MSGNQIIPITTPPIFLAGKLLAANFNTTADQPISLNGPSLYAVHSVYARNASISLSAARGGFFTGASKTGNSILVLGSAGAAAAWSNLTGAAGLALRIGGGAINGTASITSELSGAATLYLSLATAQGAPATVDLYVFGLDLTGIV